MISNFSNHHIDYLGLAFMNIQIVNLKEQKVSFEANAPSGFLNIYPLEFSKFGDQMMNKVNQSLMSFNNSDFTILLVIMRYNVRLDLIEVAPINPS